MMQVLRDNLIFLQKNIWTSTPMFVFMLVSVLYLTFDRDKSARRLVWYSDLLLVGVVYNYYLFYGVIAKIYGEGELVQLRLFWLAPFFLLMAWFLVKLSSKWKIRWISLFIVMLGSVFICWAGVPFHPHVVVERENWLKVSQEAIDSADLILGDMKENPDHLAERPTVFEASSTDVNDDITAGNAYHYGIRQYTSDFTITPVLITPEAYEAEGFNIANYYNNPSQYLICEDEMQAVGSTAQQYGYHKLGHNGMHTLFRYAREATVYLVIRGQTKGDTSGELRGVSGNASLTASGWWKILEVGEKLKDIKFDFAYASEAGQSMATAGIILRMNKYRYEAPAVTPLGYLNDISWGGYEGSKKSDVINIFGAEVLDNGDINDASYYSLIGAETRYNATIRFRAAMGDTVKWLEEDGKTILVVANPSISWWLRAVVDDEMGELAPGDYIKLKFLDGCWSVATS